MRKLKLNYRMLAGGSYPLDIFKETAIPGDTDITFGCHPIGTDPGHYVKDTT